MQQKKKKVGIIIAIAFSIIVIGIITYVFIEYSNNQSEIKQRMEMVTELYQEFKEDIGTFNDKRNEIYRIVIQDMYYQTLKEKDNEFKSLYASYEEVVTILDEDYGKLKGKCINVLYPDVSVNNKCEAFVLGYEEAINTYVNDVAIYNKNIQNYNDWATENGQEKLEKFNTEKDYIDVNGDRIYKGKKEQESAGELINETE